MHLAWAGGQTYLHRDVPLYPHGGPPHEFVVIKLGDLEIDIFNRVVRAGSAALHLTSLEQSLLYLLAANAGRVVTREEILDTLWGVDYVAESNVVDRQVRNLRAQLQDDWQHPRFIATVPGLGYRFMPRSTDGGEAGRTA